MTRGQIANELVLSQGKMLLMLLIMQHQLFGTWLFSEVRQAVWFLSQMHVFSSGRKIRPDTNWHGRGPPACEGRLRGGPEHMGRERTGPEQGMQSLLLTGLKAEDKSGWHGFCFNGR